MKTDLHRSLTSLTLVTGSTTSNREAAIAAAILYPSNVPEDEQHRAKTTALILEGMPNGSSTLDAIIDLPHVSITRITPGCLCCSGNLVMKVTLNRLLRQHPDRLFISLATSDHLENIRQILTSAPYDAHLVLTDALTVF